MKYALKNPDSFEKTLVRIIYLMSWLSVNERVGDEFLLEKKKTPAELL
jgi:hypothetical protein